MAKAAVQELLKRIHKQPGRRQRIEFPSELVVRASTAPPPGAEKPRARTRTKRA
jgi:LacI family transcriptional regulator